MSSAEKPKIQILLKDYCGMTPEEVEDYLRIEETETEWILTPKGWIEPTTFDGLMRIVRDYGGTYQRNPTVLTIPKPQAEVATTGTPRISVVEKEKTDDTTYNLQESASSLGQLVPILKDAHGNIIDGLHRQKIDPNWTSVEVKTVQNMVQLELARLATNFCRRVMNKEEIDEKILFLIGCGLKPEDIAAKTGISVRTIYRHMPQEMKDQAKVQAGTSIKTVADTCQQTVKTSDLDLVECEYCHMATHKPQPFGRYNNLCETCFEKACKTPDSFKRVVAAPKVAEPPKVKETWEERKAKMQPQVSKMEHALLLELNRMNFGPETTKEFCLKSTRPDFYFARQKVCVYIDGPVHEGKEDRDDALREELAKRFGFHVVSLKYDNFTEGEVERLLKEIKEALKW